MTVRSSETVLDTYHYASSNSRHLAHSTSTHHSLPFSLLHHHHDHHPRLNRSINAYGTGYLMEYRRQLRRFAPAGGSAHRLRRRPLLLLDPRPLARGEPLGQRINHRSHNRTNTHIFSIINSIADRSVSLLII